MLGQADRELFLLINSFHSPFWDSVMAAVSGRLTWIPLYLFIILFLAKERGRESVILILLVIIAVAIADLASVHLFKNIFMRLRPCHEPDLEGLIHLVTGRCGGKYGFVSSHAANSFAIAVLSALFLRRRWFSIIIIAWASIVSYSRVYLGVHYPGDIIGGAILGILVAFLIYHVTTHLHSTTWWYRTFKKKL